MTILSNGHQWKFSEFLDNKDYSFSKKNILSSLSEKEIDDAYSSISKWEGYAPGDTILKYGHDIGKVVKSIKKGEHVHVHNVKTKKW